MITERVTRWMRGVKRTVAPRSPVGLPDGSRSLPLEGWRDGMKPETFARVAAIHPHWHGHLRLSNIDRSVQHETHHDRGTYELAGRTLTVFWEHYDPDVFFERSGTYVHQALLEMPEIEHFRAVGVNRKPLVTTRVSVLVPGTRHEVSLRLGTTDVASFIQVLVNREYDSQSLPATANVIVDLGANIGLASVFFGLKYPAARILAVEPEAKNHRIMVANLEALGDRVQTRNAAVWVTDGVINLHTEDEKGLTLGNWGPRVSEQASRSGTMTECHKPATLLDEAGLATVDILKVDIEGAELEIFSDAAEQWLPRVGLIIVETHDRFRPGSEAAVREALHPMFEELREPGSNLFFRRRPA
jgi:FkbM family methyltransferase